MSRRPSDATDRVRVAEQSVEPGASIVWHRVLPHLPIRGTSTPERSGAVLADMALGQRFPDLRGGYVDIDQVTRASDESYDTTREARLWEVLESLTASDS